MLITGLCTPAYNRNIIRRRQRDKLEASLPSYHTGVFMPIAIYQHKASTAAPLVWFHLVHLKPPLPPSVYRLADVSRGPRALSLSANAHLSTMRSPAACPLTHIHPLLLSRSIMQRSVLPRAICIPAHHCYPH